MPFRLNRMEPYKRPEPLDQQGRGGEPSLAYFRAFMDWIDRIRRHGDGMAEGSFTEHARFELARWLKANGLDKWYSPITFQYRLHRHRTVTVVITGPNIWHRRHRGNGSKGFVLEGRIVSMDGEPTAYGKWGEFALNRIVGRSPIRALAEGNRP